MNLGEKILSDLVVALIGYIQISKWKPQRINYLLFYQSNIFKKLN
jgi:hypothetical protein